MPRAPRRVLSLRIRLTVSYVFLFSLVVVGVGFLFRGTLSYILRNRTSESLSREWAAVRGYVKIERHRPIWFYDRDDPEETAVMERLRRVMLIADAKGIVLYVSPEYGELGVETREEIASLIGGRPVERVRTSVNGVRYLVRAGPHIDDGKKEFLLSMGQPLDSDERLVAEFSNQYFAIVPMLLLAIGVAGWFLAGRALRPVIDVGAAASSITGDNLSLRIPLRGSGDELDHLIASFNAMVDRLESSFNQVRRFSTDVSHELRTPLTAMRGQLEVALFTARTPDQLREAISGAIEDVDRLTSVVRALLHLSQAETGQIALTRETVDLGAIAARAMEQFQIAAEVEGLSLETQIGENALVTGDRVQLERLIANLLANAVKYTPSGGAISLRVTRAGEAVELIVEDTGRGIAPEHLPHIFERLYRVPDGNRNPEKGLGLGLSFVAWIARVHDARIHVDSSLGHGTRFCVTFAPAPPAFPRPAEIESVHESGHHGSRA